MKKIVLMLFSLTMLTLPVHADQASPESVKMLLEKTGAGNMGIQAMNQMIPSLRQMIPDAPETFWEDFMSEFSPDAFVDAIVPIYQRYLTQDDLEAIIAFYDTPAGKKLIETQPMILQDSMEVGQQWGQEVAQQVMERYEAQKQ